MRIFSKKGYIDLEVVVIAAIYAVRQGEGHKNFRRSNVLQNLG